MWENNEKILISLTEFGRSVLARHHQIASALILVPDQLGPRLGAGKPIIWQRDALDGATVMSQAAFSTVACQKNSPFLLSSKLERKQRLFFFTHLPIRFPLMAASDSHMMFDFGFDPFLFPQRIVQPQCHRHVVIFQRMEFKYSCESSYWMHYETF